MCSTGRTTGSTATTDTTALVGLRCRSAGCFRCCRRRGGWRSSERVRKWDWVRLVITYLTDPNRSDYSCRWRDRLALLVCLFSFAGCAWGDVTGRAGASADIVMNATVRDGSGRQGHLAKIGVMGVAK